MSWNFRNLSLQYRICLIWIFGSLLWCLILGGRAACYIRLIDKLEKTGCTIESAEFYEGIFVITGDDDFPLQITYSYRYDDKEYICKRYGILEKYREGPSWIKRDYHAGMPAVCYVNPEKPSQAFLDIKWNYRDIISVMFLPLILFVLGVIGFVHWRFWGDGP